MAVRVLSIVGAEHGFGTVEGGEPEIGRWWWCQGEEGYERWLPPETRESGRSDQVGSRWEQSRERERENKIEVTKGTQPVTRSGVKVSHTGHVVSSKHTRQNTQAHLTRNNDKSCSTDQLFGYRGSFHGQKFLNCFPYQTYQLQMIANHRTAI